jgi:hypothetical protein
VTGDISAGIFADTSVIPPGGFELHDLGPETGALNTTIQPVRSPPFIAVYIRKNRQYARRKELSQLPRSISVQGLFIFPAPATARQLFTEDRNTKKSGHLTMSRV